MVKYCLLASVHSTNALAAHPDPERFVVEFSGSDHAVVEYLVTEMLEHQPADVQTMLLRTSRRRTVNPDPPSAGQL